MTQRVFSETSLEMLQQDLDGETHAITRYKERIAQAEALREYGLRRILEAAPQVEALRPRHWEQWSLRE